MSKKVTVTEGSVFDELYDDKEQAADMEIRARIMLAVREFAKKSELTQTELGKVLKITQARVSDLLTGKLDKFSVGMLITLAIRAGLGVDVRVKTKARKKALARARAEKPISTKKKAKSA